MAIDIKKTRRIFQMSNNNGKTIDLIDPNPAMTINEVSEFHSATHPQLLNSSYEQTESNGDLLIVFKTVAGTKG